MTGEDQARRTIWTIGHSNLPIDQFLTLLHMHRVEAIADVRRFPGSRRHPQFSRDNLPVTLAQSNVRYLWLSALGGRRRPAADSPHTAWRNTSFRGYADHLQSAEFAAGLAELLAFAAAQRTAVMCSEVLWWRCHRALICDVLRVRGIEVIHILGGGKTVPHPFTSPARVVNGQLTYGE